MTRDDIIKLAREAGISRLPDNLGDGWWQADSTAELERFAALVAAQEREACEKEAQERVDSLYIMYEQACQQRDALMDQQRAQIEAMRGRIQ